MILLLATAAGVFASVLYCLLRVFPVARARRDADSRTDCIPDEGFEPVSVIVYSQDEADALQELLPELLRQDYPAPFEIIVVNEGDSPDVRDTVAMLQDPGNNLYITYTPDGARNLSRKKLALTLGVKAARHPIVVMTCADTEIRSAMWLRRMARGLAAGADIVLGYAVPDFDLDDSVGKRTRAFDYAADSARWISAALTHRTFRGDGHNLAYRRELFFSNRGFSRSLNLHWGDDDIFVSEIAGGPHRKTAVELSTDSIVYLRGGATPRAFKERIARRSFTERFIPRRPRRFRAVAGWGSLIAVGSAVAASALGIASTGNLLPLVVAAALLILMWVVQIVAWRAATSALQCRTLCLTVPWLALTRPLRLAWRRILTRLRHGKQYTWD